MANPGSTCWQGFILHQNKAYKPVLELSVMIRLLTSDTGDNLIPSL